MNTYISVLRGINVNGKNIIQMDTLKRMYETLGYRDVKTYIQSGNVIFNATEQNTTDLQDPIVNQIHDDFGYDVKVLVLTVEKLNKIIKSRPFINIDVSKLHVTFLSEVPIDIPLHEILDRKSSVELLKIEREAVYLYCPEGYGKTKLSNGFLEKKLKVTATTRNWNTINKLSELALENI